MIIIGRFNEDEKDKEDCTCEECRHYSNIDGKYSYNGFCGLKNMSTDGDNQMCISGYVR